MTINRQSCGNELEWLAFCYAAGELSEQESDQFESRLATEQSAREALARTVELTQAVVAAKSVGWAVPTESRDHQIAAQVSLAAPIGSKSNYRRVWVGMGVAAAILLVLNLTGFLDLTVHAPQRPSPQRQQLAFAWTEARAQMDSVADTDIWPVLDALNDVDNDLATDISPAEIAETPSWLTAALLGQMTSAAPESLNDGPLEN